MEFDIKQLASAMRLIAEEKNLPEETVAEIVEQALAAAYKRDYGDREQNVRVNVNLQTGAVDVYVEKEVVEEVENADFEMSLKDAVKMKKDIKVGDAIEQFSDVKVFGRVAAQTAKQVIMQRLREAEREIVMAEFEDKIGNVVSAIVARTEPRLVRLEVGQAQAIMPASEQSRSERYFPGQRLRVYLKEIEKGFRGPQLIVSRASGDLIRKLFEAEVPEMDTGAVEIKGIAREAGVRTKIAVHSTVQGVDPVGTFVGGHGTRVNAIVGEIGEQEKIDIVVWDENPEVYISSALSPTKVTSVKMIDNGTKAKVLVPEDQLSVAIGKSGQNVRLASKLTGIELDIEAVKEKGEQAPAPTEKAEQTVADVAKPKLKRKSDLENSLLSAIDEHGNKVQESLNDGTPMEFEGNLWRDFVTIIDPLGNEFDPIGFLGACQDSDTLPKGGKFSSWEQFYSTKPEFIAYHLLSVASNLEESDNQDMRETLLTAAYRVAETLITSRDMGFGTRGDVIESLFWERFDKSEYGKCDDLLAEVERHCNSEAAHYARLANDDPEGFKRSLRERDDKHK